MGWANDAVFALSQGRSVQVQPFGGSMRGRIESGQLVTLAPVDPPALKAGDAVLVRWKGGYLLHLIHSLDGDHAVIGNNLGKINGAVPRSEVLGLVTEVVDEPTAFGVVLSQQHPLRFRVLLDSGSEVDAVCPKTLALRIAPADRVVIGGLWNSQPNIQSFAASPDAGETTGVSS